MTIGREAGAALAALALIGLPIGRGSAAEAGPSGHAGLAPCAAQAGGAKVAQDTEVQDSVSHARSVEMPEWRTAAVAERAAEQYRKAGRFAEALEEARRAQEIGRRPEWPREYYPGILLQGRILLDLGRYREALPLLTVVEGRISTSDPLKAEIALCRLKLGDLAGARAYDVQSVLADRYANNALVGLPGDATPTQLEASLWLDRCSGNEGAFLKSQWAIRAARLAPRCVAANLHAARGLVVIGQRRTARPYYQRAASASKCRMQEEAARALRDHGEEFWKDRYPQGTIPPPPGEGIDPVPDP